MDFTVLASGSSGNANLIRAGNFGLLIDVGLGPQRLGARLRTVGSSWAQINAVLLTHVHGDHWKDRSLRYLRQNKIPLYCHADHEVDLIRFTPAVGHLRANKLLRLYQHDAEVVLDRGLTFRALPVVHDSRPTCGFRVEGPTGSIGYVSDLGSWHPSLAQALADVDVLAVEFNHDVAMQKASGRDPQLIERVLGDAGHLSNEQAAALVREVLTRSQPGRVRHLVQLHLSRQCNLPGLAQKAARQTFKELGVALALHTAEQEHPGPVLRIDAAAGLPTRPHTAARPVVYHQPLLPGWAD
jgi:phosphoribosyl 1,2-cyclic phosphodiesterase